MINLYRTIVLPLSVVLLGFSNVLSQQNFESKLYIEINERVNFYDLNSNYSLRSDTIFFSFSGFLIDPDYDTFETKGGKTYIVVTYPDFKGGKNQEMTSYAMIPSEFEIDSSYKWVRHSIIGENGRLLMIEKEKFDNLDKTTLYDNGFFRKRPFNLTFMKFLKNVGYVSPKFKNYKLTTGILTVPFKLRSAQDTLSNFKMTTDVSLGPYIGITKRLSKRNNYYATIPFTLGLSFINIDDNSTTLSNSDFSDVDIVPGFSWSSGLIIQIESFTIGYVFGKDYASSIGKDWLYHDEYWHSFAIGYSFVKSE